VATFGGLMLLAGCGEKQPPSSEAIAVVGGKPITRGEFHEELVRRYGPLQLRDLVDQTIVEQLARKQGIRLDPARVQAKMEQAVAQAGGKQRFQENLAKELKTEEMLRASFAREALAEQVVSAQAQPSEQAIKQYYQSHQDEFKHGEMIRGRLILLESRQNAEEVRKVLQEPTSDFAGLAKALSIDPGTKEKDGDMGWIERGDYNSKLTDAAFKLSPGQVTDVIEYPDGFALVKVEGKQPAGVRPLQEAHDTIRSILAREKESQALAAWAPEQRKQARISIPDRALRAAFELIRGK
jgi:parvulin-like peptidyl-prolyl isomerase